MVDPESAGTPARAEGASARTLALAPGVTIDYLPIPENLRGLVLTLFHFTSELPELADLFPAMTGFISIRLKGSSWIEAADGQRRMVPPGALMAPTDRATPIGASGPFHALGAVLSPLGWAALTELHAGENAGRMFDLGAVFGEPWQATALRLQDDYQRGAPVRELADELARHIASRIGPIDPRHEELIRATGKWLASSLDPPLDDLYAGTAYSTRQVQRLIERYHGCAPKLLVRKFRALRVFAMLLLPTTSDEQAAAVINLYYDQSHLIREFKRFIGRTPRQLAAVRLPVLAAMLEQRNFRPVWPEDEPERDG